MARKKKFGDLTKRSQDRIARAGSEYGLTRRQARERYNRGTFNPLSRNPDKAVPRNAPYYPVSTGNTLKDAALRNMDAKLGERFGYNRDRVKEAVDKHASDDALRRMANASDDELENWAQFQRKYSYKGQATPEWNRDLGWSSNGRWRNVFWYH